MVHSEGQSQLLLIYCTAGNYGKFIFVHPLFYKVTVLLITTHFSLHLISSHLPFLPPSLVRWTFNGSDQPSLILMCVIWEITSFFYNLTDFHLAIKIFNSRRFWFHTKFPKAFSTYSNEYNPLEAILTVFAYFWLCLHVPNFKKFTMPMLLFFQHNLSYLTCLLFFHFFHSILPYWTHIPCKILNPIWKMVNFLIS